jgi:hypothetical protein
MTFQIGMVGSDGVLLASDTLCTVDPPLSGSIRHTYNTPKIELDEHNGIAYCWSGDQLGRLTTQIVSETLGEVPHHLNFKQFLYTSAQAAIIKASALKTDGDVRMFRHCMSQIVIRRSARLELWKLEIINQGNCGIPVQIYPEEMSAKCFTGDVSNQAVYFAERHFQKLPIKDLTLLAAHSVIMASKFSSGVGGLQIALCRESGFSILSDEEIADLRERSKKLDSDLAISLGVQLL